MDFGATLMTLPNPNHLHKDPIPNIVRWGHSLNIYIWGGHNSVHNKLPWQNTMDQVAEITEVHLLAALEAGHLRSVCWWFLWRPLFLACRLPPCCPHMTFSLPTHSCCLFFPWRHQAYCTSTLSVMTLFDLNCLVKDFIFKSSHILRCEELGFQYMNVQVHSSLRNNIALGLLNDCPVLTHVRWKCVLLEVHIYAWVLNQVLP